MEDGARRACQKACPETPTEGEKKRLLAAKMDLPWTDYHTIAQGVLTSLGIRN